MRVEMYATLYLYLLCIHAAIEHLYRIEFKPRRNNLQLAMFWEPCR